MGKITEEEQIIQVKIHPIPINGKTGLEIRKCWSFGEKNDAFLSELIKASFEKRPITAKIQINFSDELKAKLTLEKLGIKI